MDEYQFYPSTPALVSRVWNKFKNRQFDCVCDPNAGEGDLLKGHPEFGYLTRKGRILAIEIDPTKHPALRAKNIDIVGHDFLAYQSAAHVSHFVMNPPFSEGAKHVLHAWNGLFQGEISAILNAQTIRNACTRERQQLLRVIEQSGGNVEFVEDAFLDPEARRKTSVEIVIIHLEKTAGLDTLYGDLVADLSTDNTNPQEADLDINSAELMFPRSWVENAVNTFDAAVIAQREAVLAQAKANHYSNRLGMTLAARNGDKGSDYRPNDAAFIRKQLAANYDSLKDRAWASVLRSTEVKDKLSRQAQKRLEAEFQGIKSLEFTKANVYGFLQGLSESGFEIQMSMLCDVFDEITKYHLDNTVFHMGWASNSQHRTLGMRIKAKRFILPLGSSDGWSSELPFDTIKLLSDFDKVFAILDGKKKPEYGLEQMATEHFKRRELRAKSLFHGDRCSSSYFDMRYYRGVGTGHFYPTRPDLIERLNRLVGQKRRWLPPEDNLAGKDFWTHIRKAEQRNEDVVKAYLSKAGGCTALGIGQLRGGDKASQETIKRLLVESVIDVATTHGLDIVQAIGQGDNRDMLRLAA